MTPSGIEPPTCQVKSMEDGKIMVNIVPWYKNCGKMRDDFIYISGRIML
jgi:hypothetical protein